jgi:predicted ferric reductase
MQRPTLRPVMSNEPTRASDTTGPLVVLLVAIGAVWLLAFLTLMGVSLSPLTWYLARASGLTLYLLFWLSVVSGLGLTTALLDAFGGRASVWIAHRFVTELAFAFLALHMLSLAADPSVSLGFTGVLLPFTSHVRQPWTDLGILSGMGMVALAVSFSLRRYIGTIGWRLLHYGAFPLWVMALLHGIGAGSDSSRPWAMLLYGSTTLVVVFLSLFRLFQRTARVGSRADER